ncbi:MAG: hypothetical protein QM765_42170 [Myxococcales bacterium]
MSLEHRRGCCTWLAPITRSSGKARVGSFEVLDAEPVGGDFGGFLHKAGNPVPAMVH